MKLWILNLGAAVSLVLCIGVTAVWARSLARFDDLCWTTPTSCTNVVSLRGKLHVQVASASAPLWPTGRQWDALPAKNVRYNSGPYQWEASGFAGGFRTNRFGKTSTAERVLVTPYWFLLLITMILPGLWASGARRKRIMRRRAARGLCLHCGYDLRGSIGRCPECGSPDRQSDGQGANLA